MRRRLLAATLGIVGAGAAFGVPSFVIVAVVPAAVLAVDAAVTPSSPSVSVDRELSATAPELGERVRVRVTVTNEGSTIRDCVLADAPPPGLDAIDEPRERVRLPAGETAELAYEVVARRGSHEFGAVRVTARGVLDDRVVETDVTTALECRPANRPLELGATATRTLQGGPDDTGGSGVEFHTVREYQPSDPQRRIDWRRFARTRELTTVEYREESAETVHLLVDARPAGAVRGRPAWPAAVAYCADAVERLADALTARGVRVGVGLYPDATFAVPPGNGPGHAEKRRRLLDGSESFPWGDGLDLPTPDAAVAEGGLPAALDGKARVVLASPLLDDDPVEFVTDAVDAGQDVGVLAPDVGGAGPGATVERALRADRIAQLDGLGVPLVDWDVDAPLERAVAEVFATWT